jgi:hypothetical protein
MVVALLWFWFCFLVVDYRYPFCPCVCMYMERCAVGPRPQGLLERPVEDFFLSLFLFGVPWAGGRRRRGIVVEEARHYMYRPMKYGYSPPKRPPPSQRHNHAFESQKLYGNRFSSSN